MAYQFQNLLNQFHLISKKYQEMDAVSGDNFNIFKILGFSTSEVRTHSALLAELLNTKGEHLQGRVFLDLFLEVIDSKIKSENFIKKFDEFETSNSQAVAEFYVGKKTDDAGGYIDILIREKGMRNSIIIENKIHAGDQENQLWRYYNHDPNGLLIYLTLDGKGASAYSTKKNLEEGIHYISISYKKEIMEWLVKCHVAMVDKPVLRETIKQYIILIKQLTHQSKTNKMDNELKEILLKKDNYESAILIRDTINNLHNDIDFKVSESIGKQFKEMYPDSTERDKVLLFKYNDYDIYFRLLFEGGGYRFYIMPWNNKFGCATEKDIIHIQTLITQNPYGSYYIFYNNNYSAWICSKYGEYQTDKEKYLSCYDEQNCDNYVKLLIEEGEEFRKHVMNICKEFVP